MKELNSEDVNAYINLETIDLSKNRQIWSNLIFVSLIAIPTAFWGKYSDITRIVMPLVIIIMSVWTAYLSFGIDKKQKNFTLYMGCTALVLSIVCTLAAYKILSTIIEVSATVIVVVIVLYIIGALLNALNVLRLIKKGYYHKKQKKGSMALAVLFGVLGLGITKVMGRGLEQDKVVYIMASCLMFFAFIGMIGTQNILKYILIRRFDKSTD